MLSLGHLVKRWCLAPDLRVARANAIKHIIRIAFSADKEIAVRVHVESSESVGLVRNNNRSMPGDPAVSRALELTDCRCRCMCLRPRLILKAVPRSVRLIDGKPLLIASTGVAVGLKLCPGLAAVGRPVHVLTK